MIVRDILNEATRTFEAAGIPSARLDAEVLLSFALGREKLEFLKIRKRLSMKSNFLFIENLSSADCKVNR